jgi:hypothetical protein
MLFDEGGHHRADRDDTLAVRAGGLQGFGNQDGGQAASAEPLLDFGVVENPLVVAVGDGCKADGFAGDGDGVLPLSIFAVAARAAWQPA